MKKNQFRKTLVLAIVIIFVGVCMTPGIFGRSFKRESIKVNLESDNLELSSCTFFTFDKIGSKECNVELEVEVAEDIAGMLEVLKYKIVYEPFSEETRILKSDFVDLLENNGLLPVGMSRNKVLSLLNPSWLSWFENWPGLEMKFSVLKSFINVFSKMGNFQRFFVSQEVIDLFRNSPGLGSASASLFFCSMASGGRGIPIPLFLLPRPRGFVLWAGSDYCATQVGSLLMNRGFVGFGAQSGVALGFLGVGLTYSIGGFNLYAFIGYSTFTYVNAKMIQWIIPPNNNPVISDESPANGAKDVSVSLDELSFRISDPEKDRMSYTVTTSPDIGSGSGSRKKDGVYKVPVSGLQGNTEYSWHLVVKDKYNTVEKTFSFMTEAVAPVVSNTLPVDGDSWVPADIFKLSFRLKDFQGDLMDYTVETSPDIGTGSGSGVGDGVYTVDVGGLDYSTIYTWFVNVTDGTYWTREVFSFKTQPIMVFDPFDEGWLYRKKITIDHDLVEGDLSDFPVLVSVVDSDLRDKAQVDGDDVLFMDGSGVANRLYHEIEYYDGSSGELVAWVKIPDLDGDVDTVFYMYYGNPDCANQQYPERVWYDDYIHVWHMDDSCRDSAGFDDGNDHGTSLVSGKVGDARDFEANEGDYIDCGDMAQPSDGSLTTMTWEGWVKSKSIDSIIMCKYNSQGPDYVSYYIGFNNGGKFRLGAYKAWNVNSYGETYNSYSDVGQWVYLTAVFKLGGINELYTYVDGNVVSFNQQTYNADYLWDIPVTDEIGRYGPEAGTMYADAVMDEIRWSKVVRSDAWINTSFNTMNDPSSFMSFGPEELGP